MEKLAELLFNQIEHDVSLNVEDGAIDKKIREHLQGEVLKDYLKLQDSVLSNWAERERESYKNGFIDAVRLINKISKV